MGDGAIQRAKLVLAGLLAGMALFFLGVFAGRGAGGASTVAVEPAPATPAGELKVYISGAVANPGVYTAGPGDRVEDAVRLAGGLTPEADAARVNLSLRLRDQMHVHVPRQGEAAPDPQAAAGPGPLNLNTASAAELEALPGIGPVTARRIVEYRTRNGPFKSIDDLRKAGVSQTTLTRLRERVTVQ